MRFLFRILTFLPLLVVVACHNNSTGYDHSPSYYAEESISGKSQPDFAANTRPEEIPDRKIIKEGHITFETLNLEKTRKNITELVKQMNGYVSNENSFNYNNKIEYSLTVRIPAEKFDTLINLLSGEMAKIDNKNVYLMDVTEEYIDIEARIATKKTLETRYLDLLKQANKVDEILNIERELANLRGDIESFEGRLKYLSNKVSLSTLTITFYENNSIDFGFMHKFKTALKKGWTNFLWFLIGMANLWIFILLGVLLVAGFKVYRKKKKS